MLVLIDNFDSFTQNIAYLFRGLYSRVKIINPLNQLADIISLNPRYLVIGPGPGKPEDAFLSLQAIDYFHLKIPLLGVCLGHQCLAHYFDASVHLAKQPMHGKVDLIKHDGQGVFLGLKNPLSIVRYHSLVVNPLKFSACLKMTAFTENQEIMGLRHHFLPIEGVQFHPDSILSEQGIELFANFLTFTSEKRK